MTDKDLITSFLVNNFDFSVFGEHFCAVDKISNHKYLIFDFYLYFKCIFGLYITDNNNTSLDILGEWVHKNENEIMRKIHNKFNGLKLKLGLTNWIVVDEFGNQIDTKKLNKLFDNKYDEQFLQNKFAEWESSAKILASERMLNF